MEYIAGQYSEKLVNDSKKYDTVIFISFNAFSNQNQTKMINEINDVSSNFYVISIRNPYVYLYLNQILIIILYIKQHQIQWGLLLNF